MLGKRKLEIGASAMCICHSKPHTELLNLLPPPQSRLAFWSQVDALEWWKYLIGFGEAERKWHQYLSVLIHALLTSWYLFRAGCLLNSVSLANSWGEITRFPTGLTYGWIWAERIFFQFQKWPETCQSTPVYNDFRRDVFLMFIQSTFVEHWF